MKSSGMAKGIANPLVQPQRIANPLERDYDAYGRMIKKVSDNNLMFSNARYDLTSKPHAIDQAAASPGVIPFENHSIDYTCFDKVKTITEGDNMLAYTYGYDRQRIFMEEHANGIDRTKRYVGSCEFITKTENNNTTESILTYLTGPTGVFAVVEKQGETETMHYILKDHQGNWTVIVDADGDVEQELSYDAWGNLRNPETWCVDASITPMFDRGYTGHEHLRGFGLINMNGRVYDPVMSSFLSVDRYVQQPENSQSFNRYAYCMYNPLKYVDPSGWMMSLPNGHGITPPPDGDETGYYITGVYTDMGFNSEYNCYSYGYGLNEVTVTPYGNSWAKEECKTLVWENNGGGLSAEYSGGETNVPTLGAGGGGGGFWTGGNNTSAKEYGVSSNTISYSISYAGLVTGYNKNLWKKPLSRAQKAINQKKAYNTQKALKAKGITKSVKDIKATKIANLRTGGNALAGLSIGIEALDMAQSRSCNVSNAIGVLAAIGGAFFWEVSLAYMTIETGSYLITGQSFGENIDNWIGKPIFSW